MLDLSVGHWHCSVFVAVSVVHAVMPDEFQSLSFSSVSQASYPNGSPKWPTYKWVSCRDRRIVYKLATTNAIYNIPMIAMVMLQSENSASSSQYVATDRRGATGDSIGPAMNLRHDHDGRNTDTVNQIDKM